MSYDPEPPQRPLSALALYAASLLAGVDAPRAVVLKISPRDLARYRLADVGVIVDRSRTTDPVRMAFRVGPSDAQLPRKHTQKAARAGRRRGRA